MTQDQNNGNPRAKFAIHCLDVFDSDPTQDFFRRHRAEFDTAQKVRAQPLEVSEHKTTQFTRRFFIAKGDGDVPPGQASITRQNEPRAEAQKFSENKEKRQRQRAGNRRSRAVEKKNGKIKHAKLAISRASAAG